MWGTAIGLGPLSQLEFKVFPLLVGNLLESDCTGSYASHPSNLREHNCRRVPAAKLWNSMPAFWPKLCFLLAAPANAWTRWGANRPVPMKNKGPLTADFGLRTACWSCWTFWRLHNTLECPQTPRCFIAFTWVRLASKPLGSPSLA